MQATKLIKKGLTAAYEKTDALKQFQYQNNQILNNNK